MLRCDLRRFGWRVETVVGMGVPISELSGDRHLPGRIEIEKWQSFYFMF